MYGTNCPIRRPQILVWVLVPGTNRCKLTPSPRKTVMEESIKQTLVLGFDAREQGVSWGLITPLHMPSLLPHDLCHGPSSSRWLPASPPFLFFKIIRCSSVESFWMLCWRILTIQGRMIIRSKIKAPTAERFSRNKVREGMEKVVSSSRGSKIQ